MSQMSHEKKHLLIGEYRELYPLIYLGLVGWDSNTPMFCLCMNYARASRLAMETRIWLSALSARLIPASFRCIIYTYVIYVG